MVGKQAKLLAAAPHRRRPPLALRCTRTGTSTSLALLCSPIHATLTHRGLFARQESSFPLLAYTDQRHFEKHSLTDDSTVQGRKLGHPLSPAYHSHLYHSSLGICHG